MRACYLCNYSFSPATRLVFISSLSYELDLEPLHSPIFRREVDFFNLKTYDLHGHWSEPLTADHHSPLVGGDELSPEPRDSVVGI